MSFCGSCEHWGSTTRGVDDAPCAEVMRLVEVPSETLFPSAVSALVTKRSFGCVLHTARPRVGGDVDEAHTRTEDPETSHVAAKKLDPEKLSRHRSAVFKVLYRVGGEATHEHMLKLYRHARATDEALPEQGPSGIRSRLSDLVTMGHVRDSGKRVLIRKNECIVWQITDQGYDKARREFG